MPAAGKKTTGHVRSVVKILVLKPEKLAQIEKTWRAHTA
jgi:hypothetical protein